MMTDITVARETQLFLYSLLVGAGLSLLYDLLRVLRLQMRHRPLAVTLEDVAYFLVCAMVTLGFVLKDNSGQVRGYILVGELIGWVVWHLSLGSVMVHAASAIASVLRRLCRIVLFPLYCICKLVWKIVNSLRAMVKKILKKMIQKKKYNLQRKRILLYNLCNRFKDIRTTGGDTDGSQEKEKTEH